MLLAHVLYMLRKHPNRFWFADEIDCVSLASPGLLSCHCNCQLPIANFDAYIVVQRIILASTTLRTIYLSFHLSLSDFLNSIIWSNAALGNCEVPIKVHQTLHEFSLYQGFVHAVVTSHDSKKVISDALAPSSEI